MPKISFMPNIQNINQKKNEPTPQNMSIALIPQHYYKIFFLST